MKSIHPSPLLKNALRADALVSGATGVLQLAAAERLSALLDLPANLLWGSAEFMLAYAAVTLLMASRNRLPSALVLLIIAGNVLWGVACVALPLEGLLAPNALGIGFLLMHAAAVVLLAVLEWLGLQRSGTASSVIGAERPRARESTT